MVKGRDKAWLFVGLSLLSSVMPGMGFAAPRGALVVVRNPFRPPPAVTRSLVVKGIAPASPLQKYELESFVLKGVADKEAIVLSPDGDVFIVKKGTKIGRRGEVVVGVYRDRVAVKRGDRVIYLLFPKE